MNRRFEELDRSLVDTKCRFEDSNHRFEELGRSMNQISRNILEPDISELMHRLSDEHAGRQIEDNAMHQILTMMIDTADQPGHKKFHFAGKSPRKSPHSSNPGSPLRKAPEIKT